MERLELGGVMMANLKSAQKRVQINNKKRVVNQSVKSDMRSQIKLVENLIEANEIEKAKEAFKLATKKIDKTIRKGIIHKNSGNRQKARLAKKLSV